MRCEAGYPAEPRHETWEMLDPCCTSDIRRKRHGMRVWYLSADARLTAITEALRNGGAPLKTSHKSVVREAGPWVVKESAGAWPMRLLRHTFRRARYRAGWVAAHRLREAGVCVAAPVAYMELGLGALSWGNLIVVERLEGFMNVEDFMRRLVRGSAGPAGVGRFLEGLADAVNALEETGVYHDDLSGKNILTRDGLKFWFIDLDAVELEVPYDDERRLRNHIQLYDSFCDELHDQLLAPFIMRMMPHGTDPRVWLPQVRKGQKERRRLVEARWEKEGKLQRKIVGGDHLPPRAGE